MQPDPAVPPGNAAAPSRRKTSGLAIVAFVLSLIFFLPLVPLIGTVLGIIALATFRPDRTGKGLAIAAIPVGLVVTLFLQAMLAAVAIPAFIKYTRKARTVEATEFLSRAATGARAHYHSDRFDESGRPLPRALPRAQTGWVPEAVCCQQPGRKCRSAEASWQAEPWRSLNLQMVDPHYFQYRYQSDGRQATVEARADLDCDGRFSSYKLLLAAEGEDLAVQGPIISDETE